MIYHCKRSTKTISNHDILTSDFKKFLSNLFDLWNGVQVHRDWSQIYHSLVRIINDFQFVNPMPACPSALSKITESWQGDFPQSIVFSYYEIFLLNPVPPGRARQPGAQRHCSAAAQRAASRAPPHESRPERPWNTWRQQEWMIWLLQAPAEDP